jgi:glucosylceramidase
VAFKNPDGSIVLVVANSDGNPREFAVDWHGATFATSIPAQSVATYRWKQE